jgi:fructoselysine-6-P-deglycase FrlB-like protein
MTHLFNDIAHEASRLLRSLDYSFGAGRHKLKSAAKLLRESASIYIVGIGSSWHAGMVAECMFRLSGIPALLVDASEMVHFGRIPNGASVVFLSRSGKSLEIVQLLERCHTCEVIAVWDLVINREGQGPDGKRNVSAGDDPSVPRDLSQDPKPL